MSGSEVRRTRGADDGLRAAFLYWQCRIRQIGMRTDAGRPSAGMVPEVVTAEGEPIARIITVLCRRPRHTATMELRHLARCTHDPAERRERAVAFLAERYYQSALEFSDTLTASFAADSKLAARLLALGACGLRFEQFAQRFVVACRARALPPDDPLHEATYWHNLLFNAKSPRGYTILGFEPDWSRSEAAPPRD